MTNQVKIKRRILILMQTFFQNFHNQQNSYPFKKLNHYYNHLHLFN